MMKNAISFEESRQHLRVIEGAITQQKKLIRLGRDDDEFRMIAERVLLGLQATIVMMRAQHLLVLENAVNSAEHAAIVRS